MLDRDAEVRAGLLDSAKVVPQPSQVRDDVRAVSEHLHEQARVRHASDHPMEHVVKAVQRIDSVRPEGEVQQPREGPYGAESDEHGCREHGEGAHQQVTVKDPAGDRKVRGVPVGGGHGHRKTQEQRTGHQQGGGQLQGAVPELPEHPAPAGLQPPVVHVGLPGR